MNVKSSLASSKNFKGINVTAKDIFLICALAVIYCPFFYTKMIGAYTGDTMIQTRIGLDMIAQRRLIPVEQYSWHEGLTWWPHETLWYLLDGIFYRLFGLSGLIFLASAFNYAAAGIIFFHERKTSHPLAIVSAAAVGRLLSFPNYNVRPHLASQLFLIILVYEMMSDRFPVRKASVFAITALLTAWFHGGMVPLFFVVYLVFIILEFIYRNIRSALIYLAGLAAGFAVSFINPIGAGVWTYALIQSEGQDEIRAFIDEWQPKTFSMWEMAIILIIFIAFAADGRTALFEKKVITGICLISMFLILSCMHGRFMNLLAVMVVIFCPGEFESLASWIGRNIFRIPDGKISLGGASYIILAVFCLVFAGVMSVWSVLRFIPSNDMSTASLIAAYDEGVVECVREEGFCRPYNSFNTGSWLAFYGIPVHIDNRNDLYMEEFSGTDYIRGQMLINNIDDMDAFVQEYDADSLILDLQPGTTEMYFADDIYAASDRYEVVYDNTVTSTCDAGESIRWLVVRCK